MSGMVIRGPPFDQGFLKYPGIKTVSGIFEQGTDITLQSRVHIGGFEDWLHEKSKAAKLR